MNEEKRHSMGALRVLGGIIGGVFIAGFFALIIGALIMVLWNWLMPALFSLGTITYWQGFGIALLARLLFGGMGHKWHGDDYSNKARYRYKYKTHMHHGTKRNWWFDDVYEQWWESEGARSFDAYIKREEDKEDKDDKQKDE